SRKLADTDGHSVIQQMLLKPEFGKARRRQSFVITYRHEAANIVSSDASPMNLIRVGIKAEAFPQARFVQIAKQISPKRSIVGLALADPSGVAKGLTEIKATDGEARVS